MHAIEFETFQNNGIISIPYEYINQINGRLKVIILSSENNDDLKKFDDITQSMKNPYTIKEFKNFSRDELNAR